MNTTEIVKALEEKTDVFPREALQETLHRREAMTPALLRILATVLEQAERGAPPIDGSVAHMYALYLLAQFQEARAYPLVVQLARLPRKTLHALTGEFVTEDLKRVLASVCDGNITPIASLIEDPAVSAPVKVAAIESLKILVAVGAKPRDEIMTYYKTLFAGRLERVRSIAWNALVACATRLHPAEVYDNIVAVYNEGLVDNFYMSLNDVNKVHQIDREKVLLRLSSATPGYIEDAVKDSELWHRFSHPRRRPSRPTGGVEKHVLQEKHGAAPLRPPKDMSPFRRGKQSGPNEACVCGSGKKFKKCCGRTS